MPVRVPEAVRRALGDDVVAEMIPWLEQIIDEKAVPRDEYRELLSRSDILEHDVSEIKADIRELRAEIGNLRGEVSGEINGLRREMNERFIDMERHFELRFDQINERFDQMNDRFDQMGRHFEARLDQMNERMLVQTRWLIGMIALFGTILSILMAIATFTP